MSASGITNVLGLFHAQKYVEMGVSSKVRGGLVHF